MPMHDWTRVTPNDYHDMHVTWLTAIKTSLNGGVLPPGYFAMAEHTTPPVVADVLTMTVDGESVRRPGRVAGGSAAHPAPAYTATARDKRRSQPPRRRVAVRHAEGRRLVAVVEIVSPSNKASRLELAELIGKWIQLLRQGVNLLLIDPFPPTRRDPRGLHAALWKELTGARFEPPAGKPLTLASYVARGADTITTFVEPLAVGDALRDMPLFLDPASHVNVPLEATYRTGWEAFPRELRPLVESDAPTRRRGR